MINPLRWFRRADARPAHSTAAEPAEFRPTRYTDQYGDPGLADAVAATRRAGEREKADELRAAKLAAQTALLHPDSPDRSPWTRTAEPERAVPVPVEQKVASADHALGMATGNLGIPVYPPFHSEPTVEPVAGCAPYSGTYSAASVPPSAPECPFDSLAAPAMDSGGGGYGGAE